MEAAPPDGGVGRVWFCVPFGEGGMSNCGSTLSFFASGDHHGQKPPHTNLHRLFHAGSL